MNNRVFIDAIPLPLRRALGGAAERLLAVHRQRALLRRLRGDTVECNVCGWRGAAFTDDVWHRGTICPACRSQVRHRLLVGAFTTLEAWSFTRLIEGKDVLHFAPEAQTGPLFSRLAKRYVTADHDRGDVQLRLDISAMPTVPDASFDTVVCCDVLEHVPEDRRALRELRRILRPGGVAVLTVPQRGGLARTDEDPGVTDPAQREQRFGQKDHVRMYGDDFAERITEAGFALTVVEAGDLPEALRARHVLVPPAVSPHPLATNRRRIYFSRRPA